MVSLVGARPCAPASLPTDAGKSYDYPSNSGEHPSGRALRVPHPTEESGVHRDRPAVVHASGGATPARFEGMRANAHSFTGLGAYTFGEDVTLAGAGEPEILRGVRVSAGFLQILGVAPLPAPGFHSRGRFARKRRESTPIGRFPTCKPWIA